MCHQRLWLRECEIASIVARRLDDTKKMELVEGYRAGQSTIALARTHGCSQNTVIRTVKALLPEDQYNALKEARSKGGSLNAEYEQLDSKVLNIENDFEQDRKNNDFFYQAIDIESKRSELGIELERSEGSLPLDDAGDFNNLVEEDLELEEVEVSEDLQEVNPDIFQEVAPISSEFVVEEQEPLPPMQLAPGVLPTSVYMLVERSVELDAKPLKDFPGFGYISEIDMNRKAICLFPNQRIAKRNCGRSQRVIKIPDTSVFEITTPFLLARGITRLILEDSLIALD